MNPLEGLRRSMLAKTMAAIFLCLLVVGGASSWLLLARQRRFLRANMEQFAKQLGQAIERTLWHAMLENRLQEVTFSLENVSRLADIEHVFILDREGRIALSPRRKEIGSKLRMEDKTCRVCHAGGARLVSETIVYSTGGREFLRNVTPIRNHPSCHPCHRPDHAILGVLVTDVSMDALNAQVRANAKLLLLSAALTFGSLLALLGVALWRLILAPVGALLRATRRVAAGELDVSVEWPERDEMGELVSSFNAMVAALRRQQGHLRELVARLRTRNREVSTLYSILRKVSTVMEAAQLVRIILEELRRRFRTSLCGIVVFDPLEGLARLTLMEGERLRALEARVKLDRQLLEAPPQLVPELPGLPPPPPGASEITVELAAKDRRVGLLILRREHPFAERERRLLTSLSQTFAISILNSTLYRMAVTDHLTKLFSRGYFETHAEKEIEGCKRRSSSLALLLVDVDNFKRFNDVYGHSLGDRVLVKVARAITDSLRSADIASRFGGDEFAILLPDTDHRGAKRVAERVRARLTPEGLPPGERITLSMGIASFPRSGACFKELFDRADAALYLAKARGGDAIACFEEIEERSSTARDEPEAAGVVELEAPDFGMSLDHRG